MCGIFAYFGPQKDSLPMVIAGLKKLEYRGYDSWGIADKRGDEIFIHKQTGKIGDFEAQELERCEELKGNKKPETQKNSISMGHSRWATHGGVTDSNAHPHFSENKEIVLIHNGIFENYLEVKEKLIAHGHLFRSETDTEVLAHLIEEYNKKMDFESAVRKALKEVEGRYAVLVMSQKENKIMAARRGSPLIVGIGQRAAPGSLNEYFIASDIPAFINETNQVMYLDDDQIITISEKGAVFNDLNTGAEIEKRVVEIHWKEESAEKGDFPHFMIKEITEQKETLYRAINQDEKLLEKVAAEINKAFGTYFIGCGTAGKVCMTGEYFFAEIAKKHVNFSFGSEFPAYHHFLTDRSLIIAVSQSGETADTLEALEVAKKKGAKIISIVNVESSTMARMSDLVIPIKAGREIAVASTKATTSQLAILALLAHACAGKLSEGRRVLAETASEINDMLNPRYEEHIKEIAEKIRAAESMYIIGRGKNYPMALEAAIKLQEVAYIHAEGFAGGELKHGPLALITKNTPCIVFTANDENRKAILSNAQEIKARGGMIIGIGPRKEEIFDEWIRVPDAGELSPIVNIIPVQILAYQIAVIRQNNPDMPRNLAKSVTVK